MRVKETKIRVSPGSVGPVLVGALISSVLGTSGCSLWIFNVNTGKEIPLKFLIFNVIKFPY